MVVVFAFGRVGRGAPMLGEGRDGEGLGDGGSGDGEGLGDSDGNGDSGVVVGVVTGGRRGSPDIA